MALMRRPATPESGSSATTGGGGSRRPKREGLRPPSRAALGAWREFAAEGLTEEAALRLTPTGLQGEWLVWEPDDASGSWSGGAPGLQGLRWLRHGLQLGRVREGARSTRVEPAHALAMALPTGAAARRLDLDPGDERVTLYLRGADLPAEGEPGYLRVEVDGLPLGWGKRSGGVVRSLLPKGLRRPG